ncbi:MAG: extensin family protein, partial [Alphaproteobacteria bacterium]|nr:extensin family protein [Alphaproteobacteria bacterium]
MTAAETVPLPRPRPHDLVAKPDASIPLPPLRPSLPPAAEAPAKPEPTKPPPPSACQLRLPEIAEVEALPPVIGANGCGIDDPVKMAAIRTADNRRIAVDPPATLRCTTAEAVASWVRDDIVPIAATLGAPLTAVANFDSYECRGRNRVAGAKISEHGKGNAIDIRALMLANGKHYELTDAQVDKPARERLKASACARFTTVLGPGSDGYHENHIHVDLAQRHSGYRICQWDVRDAFAVIPLPRERP